MSNPTSRRSTRKLPSAQPIGIADWKHQHGIVDFPSAAQGFQSATVYFFRHPEQLYGGNKEGELLSCELTTSWPEESIKVGDRLIVRCGPVRAGQLVCIWPQDDDRVIARLLRRDANGTIQLQDSTGEIHNFKRGECELVGEVIDFPSAAQRLR
jgi:hypothetical protein